MKTEIMSEMPMDEKIFAKSNNFMAYNEEVQNNTCKECGKKFKNTGHFKTHLMTHTGGKPYSCNFCEKSFSQKCNL